MKLREPKLSGYSSALIEDCKKYLGLAPYNTFTNINVSDPFFYNHMYKKYGVADVNYVVRNLK